MTSSAHTGERAIHSSDFSAFTKRSHYPSLLRFSGPTYLLRSSICTSATASVELCSPRGEVPWSFAAVNRRAHFIAREDPHSKCIKCLGFSHARDAVYGTSKCNLQALQEMPVEFLHDFLFPSPRARDTVSFELDDILHTAASDSEDFGPALADALPPSSQEARPSAAYSELVDVLLRATEKLALDWPDEPASLELRSSTSVSSSVRIPNLKGGKPAIFQRSASRDLQFLEASHFPPALLTRRPPDFTKLCGFCGAWSPPPCR